jgi:4-diphosphocytidyl-2-C-methyl-D-erythritol kinase
VSDPEFFPAPAKLNLFLHVVGRRPDGYHELQTVFRFIDAADRIGVVVRADGAIRRVNHLPMVPEAADLVVRAAHLLKQETGTSLGAELTVEKHLPLGGGLGGGSSDAATTLIALNKRWGTGLVRSELARLALRLGADVPVFVFGRNAFGEGVGERLQPLQLPEEWYVVLVPPVAVSTPAVFGQPDLTRNSDAIRIAAFSTGWRHWRSAFGGRNDLEPVVRRMHPEVARSLDWLAGFGDARMTGSGACVFCGFETEHEAREVLARKPADITGFVARGLEEHPLRALVED